MCDPVESSDSAGLTEVSFWFDFLSPYSWLACDRASEFAREHGVRWRYRPVVFGAILDATELVGPGEVLAKRDGMLRDVQIHAADRGLRFVGPPEHPFRSLEVLRTACFWQDRDEVAVVCRALFAAIWEQGLDLASGGCVDRIEAVLVAAGIEVPRPVGELVQDPEIKLRLRQNTEEAIAQGVYGVPSFRAVAAGAELFWGQDRMKFLARSLRAGGLPPVDAALDAMCARPIARGRGRAPSGSETKS